MINLILSLNALEIVSGLSVAALAFGIMVDFTPDYVAYMNNPANQSE